MSFAQAPSSPGILDIPCKAPSAPPNACLLFSSPCQTVVQSFVDDLDKSIQNKLDGIAAGKDKSLFQMDGQGLPIESPITNSCELAITPPEVLQNRLSRSCGNTARITLNGADMTNAPGENAYKIGASVTSIKCFWNTMKAEILAEGKIKNIPVSCQALAADAAATIAQSDTAWNQLLVRENQQAGTRNLCSAKMIRDFQGREIPDACKDDRTVATSDDEAFETAGIRQAACSLAATRSALYTAIKRVALCAMFKNSETSWRKIFEGVDNPYDVELASNYIPGLVNHTKSAVRSGCRPLYRSSCIRNKGANASTGYHRDNYWRWLRAFLLARYPVGGTCSPP